jgi:hypothetical protein
MCEKSGDAIDHLHCEVARDLWSSLCNLFGVNWVILRSVTPQSHIGKRSVTHRKWVVYKR